MRNHACNHEDWPCCGCGNEPTQEEQREQWEADHADDLEPFDDEADEEDYEDDEPEDNMTDVEADADTLRSAGWGTDEDYGYYGGEDDSYGEE